MGDVVKILKILACSACWILPLVEAMEPSPLLTVATQLDKEPHGAEAMFNDYRETLPKCDFLSSSEALLWKNVPNLQNFINNARKLKNLTTVDGRLDEECASGVEDDCKAKAKGFFAQILAKSKRNKELTNLVNSAIDQIKCTHSATEWPACVERDLKNGDPAEIIWRNNSDLFISLIDTAACEIDRYLQSSLKTSQHLNSELMPALFENLLSKTQSSDKLAKPAFEEYLVLNYNRVFDEFCFKGMLAELLNQLEQKLDVETAATFFTSETNVAALKKYETKSESVDSTQTEVASNINEQVRSILTTTYTRYKTLISPIQKECPIIAGPDDEEIQDQIILSAMHYFTMKHECQKNPTEPKTTLSNKIEERAKSGDEFVELNLMLDPAISACYNAMRLIANQKPKIREHIEDTIEDSIVDNIDSMLETIVKGEVVQVTSADDCKAFFDYLSEPITE